MTAYSSKEEIARVTDELIFGDETSFSRNGVTPGHRPSFVLDIDGNVALGHNLAPGVSLPLSPQDDPATQSIPTNQPLSRLLAEGKVEQAIFSVKPMDTRLPENLVNLMNGLEQEGRLWSDVIVLTSRDTKDAVKILAYSGVEHPERVTVVGDSGAILRFAGQQYDLRPLDAGEKQFLDSIGQSPLLTALEKGVDDILQQQGFNAGKRGRLFVEPKGIATNIHYGEVLKTYGQKEGSALDHALGDFVRQTLNLHIEKQGHTSHFKTLEGPSTVELKLRGVNKGKGLRDVVNFLQDRNYQSSAVVFAGDDICKINHEGNVSHGTDYAAFKESEKLKSQGIAAYTLHTHHPESGELNDPQPVPSKAKHAAAAGISPDLTLPDPQKTADLVVEICEKARARDREMQKKIEEKWRKGASPSGMAR